MMLININAHPSLHVPLVRTTLVRTIAVINTTVRTVTTIATIINVFTYTYIPAYVS